MPLFANKRAFLARGLRGSGLLSLIERLGRRPGLLVLTYHRIGDPASSPYYAPVASATPEALEDELRALKRTHRIVGGEDLPGLAASGFRVGGPTALVTFDDGYRDNAEAALPVLTRLGVPATFFLTTGFLDDPGLPWWDHVAYVVNATATPRLRLDWPEPVAIDLAATPRPEAIASVIKLYLDHHVDDDRRFLAGLEDRAGVHVDGPALGRSLFMSWDQARALADAGMTVGSHASTHRNLARLPEGEQRSELAGSRRALESRIGRPVDLLAYPYGWPGTFDARTKHLAREAGYRAAFSSLEGYNRPGRTEPFAVRRLGVGIADPPVLHQARWALHESLGRSAL